MDHVSIVVEDLDAAIAFFVELGMEVEGRMKVEGDWVDRVVGLDDVRAEIAMVRTPDGRGKVELSRFFHPAAIRSEPAPQNTLGLRNIMFEVDDLDDTLARLSRHGATLVREIAQYEDRYRLCYVRGPEGVLIALAQQVR